MYLLCVFSIFFSLIIGRKHGKKYDERQLLVRNFAYKTAFFTLLIYCVMCGALYLLNIVWFDLAMQMIIGTLLASTIFALICIIKDAALNFTGKSSSLWALYIFMSIWLHVYRGYKGDFDGGFLSDFLYIFLSICYLSIGTAGAVKAIIARKAERGEDHEGA